MIVTPFAANFSLNTSNQSVEAARRDNAQRETIPQPTSSEASEREQGSSGERSRQPAAQISTAVTYERPTLQVSTTVEDVGANNGQADNANDQSSGREQAEQRQREQSEQAEIRELQARDREVRAHEQAHVAVGGQYAGTPQYEFETGPDGRRYAVGGEVSIDVSEESTPEDTIRKLQQVRAAALAPVEPSPQDLRVAAEAARGVAQAQAEINRQNDETQQIEQNEISLPNRTLDNTALEENENESSFFANRNAVIARFYQQAVTAPEQQFSTFA